MSNCWSIFLLNVERSLFRMTEQHRFSLFCADDLVWMKTSSASMSVYGSVQLCNKMWAGLCPKRPKQEKFNTTAGMCAAFFFFHYQVSPAVDGYHPLPRQTRDVSVCSSLFLAKYLVIRWTGFNETLRK